jgi:hypothetical protein
VEADVFHGPVRGHALHQRGAQQPVGGLDQRARRHGHAHDARGQRRLPGQQPDGERLCVDREGQGGAAELPVDHDRAELPRLPDALELTAELRHLSDSCAGFGFVQDPPEPGARLPLSRRQPRLHQPGRGGFVQCFHHAGHARPGFLGAGEHQLLQSLLRSGGGCAPKHGRHPVSRHLGHLQPAAEEPHHYQPHGGVQSGGFRKPARRPAGHRGDAAVARARRPQHDHADLQPHRAGGAAVHARAGGAGRVRAGSRAGIEPLADDGPLGVALCGHTAHH